MEGATAADNAFYEEAIAKSEATTGSAVETVYSDGAYQNADNRALSVNGVFTGIQGRQSRYLLDESDGDTVRITDTRTGEVHGHGAERSAFPIRATGPSTSGGTSCPNNWNRCAPES